MTHPYDEVYLSQHVEEQGKFFERMQDIEPTVDSVAMMTAFLNSETRKRMDAGDAWYLTLDADAMKRVFLKSCGPFPGTPLCGFMPAWIGRFYAYAQWWWNLPSALIAARIPVRDLVTCYPGAHDLSIQAAVEKLGAPRLGNP